MDGYNAYGSGSNKQWSMDGATVTDMASNSAPTYYDFEMFEEIQITTGGMDASQESGGVSVNMVTKSGGNQLRGSGRFFVVDKALQSTNAPPEVVAQGGGAGNPLKNNTEYGVEVGGPIKRDKAWFWGSASNQKVNIGILGFLRAGAPAGSTDIDDLNDDITEINNQSAKVQYQWSTAHKSTFLFQRSDKVRNARGASSTTALESTSRQTGPTEYFNYNHQWVVSDRLMLSGQGLFNGGGFLLDFHTDDLATVQVLNHETTGDFAIGHAQRQSSPDLRGAPRRQLLPHQLSRRRSLDQVRPALSPDAGQDDYQDRRRRDGAHPQQQRSRGEHHARRLQRRARRGSGRSTSTIPGRSGRATINWGVRWDRQDDKALAAEIDANPILPDLLPAVTFTGVDAGVVYNDIAPRLGFTYDLFGDDAHGPQGQRRPLLRRRVSRISNNLSPTGQTTLSYWWKDQNGDLFAQRNEIEFNRGFRATPTANYDPEQSRRR